MLHVIMLNVIILNVIMLNVIMLNVIMLSIIMLNVVAPFQEQHNGTRYRVFLRLVSVMLSFVYAECHK
jgi:hypothetical protein